MKIRASRSIFLIAGFALITLFYLSGVPQVPFHPDESTNLFMSSDADLFWEDPAQLFWNPEKMADLRHRTQLLDPPLTRNLIAVGRWVSGQPATPVDWAWGKTWIENEQQGALPSPALLLAGRYALSVLFPLTLLLFFLAVRHAANERTAILAALLLASNALVLLHTRRSMAEGALLFTQVLVLWSLVRLEKRPWAAAVPAALAFCAKLTLAANIPVALLAVLWRPGFFTNQTRRQGLLRMGKQVVGFGLLLVGIIVFLNPFLWKQPIPALQAAVEVRQDLAAAQQADRPEQTLNRLDRQLIGMIGSLYLTPPIFAETINYTKETSASEQAYLANPLHALFRSFPAGVLLLVLNLFGFFMALRDLRVADTVIRRRLALLIAATLIQTLALLLLIPLPWQRYYLPLVPYACLWTGYGINALIELGYSFQRGVDRARLAKHLPGT